MYSDSPGGDFVTSQSLAPGGKDTILSQAVCGKRAILFVRLASGAFAVVTGTLDRDNALDRILGIVRVRADELVNLDAALAHARRVYGGAGER